MKKTILAVATSALFAASAQAATVYDSEDVTLNIYGRAQFDIIDKGEDTNGVGSARLGFKAKSMISDGFYGIARGEWQVAAENSAEDGKEFDARHVYAGFEGDSWGSVVFGQTDTAFYQAVAATDIFNKFGYEAFAGVEDGRQEGQVVYTGEFGGLYVGASYQFTNDSYTIAAGNPDTPTDEFTFGKIDNSVAATLGYSTDFGLAVYGGFHSVDFEADAEKTSYALSASYSLDALYLAAVYVSSDVEVGAADADIDGFDLVASYNLGQTDLYAGYATSEVDVAGGSMDISDVFTLGASYKFNSNIKVWAEYAAKQISGVDDQWDISVQYNF
ncbi:porin [Aliagarivorans marinus]|uniref:porin n=1 Tax=Aliagarivorans marinus TaxID=561965 RepID=UPI000416BAA2|nr:porin [Aliagarivorans marinus]